MFCDTSLQFQMSIVVTQKCFIETIHWHQGSLLNGQQICTHRQGIHGK